MTTVHISFSQVAQLLPIAPRTTRLIAKLHSIACSCECGCCSAGGRAGRRRHRSLCGRTRVSAGSALSWTSRVSRARITSMGGRQPILVVRQQSRYELEMTASRHCQAHSQCPAHYTSHCSYQRCGESCRPQCMGQRSCAVLCEILHSIYCRHNISCDLKLSN